jgi:hypothetical protein
MDLIWLGGVLSYSIFIRLVLIQVQTECSARVMAHVVRPQYSEARCK